MNPSVEVITERIDDVVLLLHVMMGMGLPEVLNAHLPRHWKQSGLDWGWVVVIWLSYILSEGDHRKVVVRAIGGPGLAVALGAALLYPTDVAAIASRWHSWSNWRHSGGRNFCSLTTSWRTESSRM
jgi:hypothetical protein